MIRKDLYFHEAIVLEFIKYPNKIELKLERVLCGGQLKNVELSFHGIRKLEVDHKPAELPLMATPDGEVLTLILKDNAMELLIDWDDFDRHENFTKYYNIEFEEVLIKITETEIPSEFQNVKIKDLNFNESPCVQQPFTWVLKFERNPTSILLCLDGIKVGKWLQYVELLFEGVKRVEVDNKQTGLPLMTTANGRLVTCMLNDNSIELLIQWNNFNENAPFVRSYFIEFEKMHIKVL
jgi:hypothetical protein